MSSADWTTLDDGLDAASVRRGVTVGATPPAGGGNFTFGFHSVVTSAGAVGLYTNQTAFAPMGAGGTIRGAVKRAPSGGPLNFAPMLFLGLQDHSVNASGYLFGPDDDDPHRLILRKGSIASGLPVGSLGTLGILAAGTETFIVNTWLHLRLDMIVNPNGDVILSGFRNDPLVHDVTAPVWIPVPGCEVFVDDVLGVNSGSAPFTSGYGGFAFQTRDVSRRAYFDHLEIARQT